jgi:nucleoside-diphosphate-sugar epimerase
MRVLVTGATGFLGKRLVHHLLGRGFQVRCLVRSTANLEALRAEAGEDGRHRLEFCSGSLARIDACAEAVQGCAVVFHLAASLSGATATLFLDNVIGTRKLIDLVHRASVRRLVLVSSLAVYGTAPLAPGAVLDEGCGLEPEPHRRDPYTYSKVVQEQVAWEAYGQGQLPLVVVRPGVIYGPGRDCLTNRVGLRFGNLLLRMGGRQVLPYTFVDNCAEALALAGTAEGVEGQAVNIVDDNPPTCRELVRGYRRAVKRIRVLPVAGVAIGPLSRLFEWYSQRSGGQLPAVLTRYKSMAQWKPLRYSNAKAKALLRWSPRVNFADGLQQTFAWLRLQGGGSKVPAATN